MIRRANKKNIFILMVLCTVAAATAQWETGFAVLQIGAGARASAMGEAFTAVAGDASASFWNPAGSAALERRQAHFTHNAWIQDVSHDAAAVLFPARRLTFGLHAMVISVPGIEQRNYPTDDPLSTFSAHDIVLGVTLAKKIGDDLALGLNLRYLNEKIYIETASGFSIDLGAQYQTPLKGMSAGLMVQHLGATNDLVAQKITLPRTLRAGVAYVLPIGAPESPWLLSADLVSIRNQESHLHVGAEIRPLDMLALRAGYQTGYETRDLSAGFGLQLGRGEFDYAFVPFQEDLGQAHRFSLTLAF
jgi:hypothetical protein